MAAQLESIIGEPFHFLQSPLLVLSAILRAIAEEIVPRGAAVQHAKRRSIVPPWMCFRKIEPDADTARWIDGQLSIVVDVAELLSRGVVEHEDDGRHSRWHFVKILV